MKGLCLTQGKHRAEELGSEREGNAGPTGRGDQEDEQLKRTWTHASGNCEGRYLSTSGQPPRAERWRALPPSLPILHSQLTAPAGVPQFMYPLPTAAACDPSTGMLLGTAPRDTPSPPQLLPPSVHMSTAIPLGPPRTMPSETTPHSALPHPLPPSQPSTPPTRPDVTDACLQTSFSVKEEYKERNKHSPPNLVLEVCTDNILTYVYVYYISCTYMQVLFRYTISIMRNCCGCSQP